MNFIREWWFRRKLRKHFRNMINTLIEAGVPYRAAARIAEDAVHARMAGMEWDFIEKLVKARMVEAMRTRN